MAPPGLPAAVVPVHQEFGAGHGEDGQWPPTAHSEVGTTPRTQGLLRLDQGEKQHHHTVLANISTQS